MKLRKMPKKSVSKTAYLVCNVIFYMLCLSGLIWQVTQISINFFKFDVNKDINIKLPEETFDGKNYALYSCFNNVEMLESGAYERYLRQKKPNSGHQQTMTEKLKNLRGMTIGERFNMSIRISAVKEDTFIYGDELCRQSELRYPNSNFFLRKRINESTAISVSLGDPLPLFDKRRQQMVVNLGPRDETRKILISLSWYYIHRLSRPYSDRCLNYSNLYNVSNRLGAIIDCKNDVSFAIGKVFRKRIVRKNNKKLSNYTVDLFDITNGECEIKYNSPDCDQKIYLTELSNPRNESAEFPSLIFEKEKDRSPSFTIKSKPRIDDIDFVTYIFGALGFWMGFSFMDINPIRRFLEIRKQSLDEASGVERKDNEIQQIKLKLWNLEQHNALLMYQNTTLMQQVARRAEILQERDRSKVANQKLEEKMAMAMAKIYQEIQSLKEK